MRGEVGKRTEDEQRGNPAMTDAAMPGKRPLTGELPQAAAERTVAALAPRFGGAFPGANVHTGKTGDQRARAHGTVAIAEGRDIFLGETVDPESAHGTKIVAHEMAHVIQQTGEARGVRPRGDALEAEAHQVGDVVAAGGTASPKLRTGGAVAQGYDSFEHKSMGDDVHSILAPVAAGTEDPVAKVSRPPELGGAPVPQLAEMLQRDPFLHERSRSLSISLRNFKLMSDAAGAYLGIEIDPATQQATRYDVPVSPGDLTALNGDLYGSVENMRKAPVAELIGLQGILDDEARWERDVAAGTAQRRDMPNFDAKWEAATAWRARPVYAAGRKLGVEGDASGSDRADFTGLALENHAHFGEDTADKQALEIEVRTGNLDALAQGPQGNFARGNEQAWMDGHARALVLAREAHALSAQPVASISAYGHETAVPPTGLVHPDAGSAKLPPVPMGADGKPLARSAYTSTFESKLNDAYVENAGADHYLTDAFAAGHQIVREVIGRVTKKFVEDSGGRAKFLDFVVDKLQRAAVKDPAAAPGELGTFQQYSRSWWKEGVARYGMKQKLEKKIDDATLRSIGAKVVHDYYNRHGIPVHNQKGMSFEIKGDDTASEAPEARKIIAMAVLASRDQITDMAHSGTAGSPLDVWAYTPDLDKTAFTQADGPSVMKQMFDDGDYLWALIKDNFSLGEPPDTEPERVASKNNPAQQAIAGGGRTVADVGTAPMRAWLERRRQYVQSLSGTAPPAHHATTVDGVAVPGGER